MRDGRPADDTQAAKRWVLNDYASPVLYEYDNEKMLFDKRQSIK